MALPVLEQRAHDLEAELNGLAATIEREDRPLTAEERERRDTIMADLPGMRADIDFARSRQAQILDEAAAVSQVQSNEQPSRVFASIGHQLQAIVRAETGDFGARNQLIQAAASGAGEAISEDGGFLLVPEFTGGIERIMHDQGQILQLVNPIAIGGNELVTRFIDETSRVDGSRNGAVAGYWVEEGTAPTASQLKFRRAAWRLKKVAAVGYATDELIADVVALGQEMQSAFAEELVFKVEDAFVNGSGVGMPKGIINEACLVSVAKEAGQAAATIVYDNLLKMYARAHSRSKGRGVWMYNTDCFPQLWQLYIAAGTGALPARFITYDDNGQLRIFGRPAIEIEYAQTLGTTGDIYFADWSQYKAITKEGGVQSASSMHVRFLQDEMTFRATYRVDGGAKWAAALTPFKGSNTLSPFIKLDTRA